MRLPEFLSLFARYLHRINDIDIVQMCGLSEGTDANTLKTVRDVVYQIYNQQYTLTAQDNIPMTACAVQAISTYCYYLVSVDGDGIITVTKGTDNTAAIPAVPAGQIAIGALKIATDGVTTFTSGTTDLSAAGLTVTYYDMDTGIATHLVNSAMRKIERKYNLRGMKVRTTYALSAGTAIFANPITNYKELISIHAETTSTRYLLRKVDIAYAENIFPIGQTGYPRVIAEVPVAESTLTPDVSPSLSMIVRPIPDIAYTIYFNGYQYTPFLDNVLYQENWWLNNAHEILLFGALTEAAPYLINDDRISTWSQLFNDALWNLINAERTEQYAGSLQYPYPDNVY